MKDNAFIGFLIMALLIGCKEEKKNDPYIWIPLEVTATAYNSVQSQTNEDPTITAWGDTLVPGMKSLAVSRDLIVKGLKHGTMVRIENFPDTFFVNDKMHHRWRNKIDIYMGKDRKRAKEWGRRKVCIEYAVLKENREPSSKATKLKQGVENEY
ncbi:3D domain-containing protein [Maribacter arenosus]|nr:3D domain-containing protein [Maribacter arenosus]